MAKTAKEQLAEAFGALFQRRGDMMYLKPGRIKDRLRVREELAAQSARESAREVQNKVQS